MKKYLVFMFCLLFSVSFVSCKGSSKDKKSDSLTKTPEVTEKGGSGSEVPGPSENPNDGNASTTFKSAVEKIKVGFINFNMSKPKIRELGITINGGTSASIDIPTALTVSDSPSDTADLIEIGITSLSDPIYVAKSSSTVGFLLSFFVTYAKSSTPKTPCFVGKCGPNSNVTFHTEKSDNDAGYVYIADK